MKAPINAAIEALEENLGWIVKDDEDYVKTQKALADLKAWRDGVPVNTQKLKDRYIEVFDPTHEEAEEIFKSMLHLLKGVEDEK